MSRVVTRGCRLTATRRSAHDADRLSDSYEQRRQTFAFAASFDVLYSKINVARIVTTLVAARFTYASH